MALSILGYESKITNGALTIPADCSLICAVVIGSEAAPWINGIQMDTKAVESAQGVLDALSVHVLPVTLNETVPFIMEGNLAAFYYFEDGVSCRPKPAKGYSAAGEVTETFVTTTDEIMIGVVLGNNGQVTLTADDGAFTYDIDTTTYRIGHKTPGDSSQTIVASDPGTTSGYWYNPPAVWHDTTTSVLVTAGYYQTTSVYHDYRLVYSHYSGEYYYYDYGIYSNAGDPNYTTGFVEIAANQPLEGYIGSIHIESTFYTHVQTWIPPVYEEQPSGYWEYPDPVWVTTGAPGYVSAIVVSIAATMLGSVYVTRPLIA